MTEKDLILKLNKLSTIKPNQEWVALTKNQILSSGIKENKQNFGVQLMANWNSVFTMVYGRKLAYAFSALLLLAVGSLGIMKFYNPQSVKTVALHQTASLLSSNSQLQDNFVLANKKLQELTLAIRENKTSDINPAIDEFKQSVAMVAKNLNNENLTTSSQDLKEIASNIKKLKDGRKELVLSGLAINDTKESKDLDTAESVLVQRLINDLDKTTLTEEQQKKMTEIKELYANKDYGTALEEILTINN